MNEEIRRYSTDDAPTLRRFHETLAQNRAVVGPVGSAKTSAAAWESCFYLPQWCFEVYGLTHTKWVIVRNTYTELLDTTQSTVFHWFPFGEEEKQARKYHLSYPGGYSTTLLFRSCDRPEDVKKFKSLEVTGCWIDESCEVATKIKLMLKNRIGRYPNWETWTECLQRKFPETRGMTPKQLQRWVLKNPMIVTKFFLETSNPPNVEDDLYSDYDWGNQPPPGPVPKRKPLKRHYGFWQRPGENSKYLRPGYYDELREDYKNNPDWLEMYIEGKPGVIVQGKLVYNNFKRRHHVAAAPLVWTGGDILRGWDNTGNTPAVVIGQVPSPRQLQILAEYHGDKMGIVDFTKHVIEQCAIEFPGARCIDYADPAGENRFSRPTGGLTSNAELMRDAGVNPIPAEQAFTARIQAVEKRLREIDGLLIDPSCIRLINGFLGGYCYPEIGTSGVYAAEPKKNQYSHPHDGLQYLCTGLDAGAVADDKPLPPVTAAESYGDGGFISDRVKP